MGAREDFALGEGKAFLGPFQQEDKSGKAAPLGAALAEIGVSSYWELVLCDTEGITFSIFYRCYVEREPLASEQEP